MHPFVDGALLKCNVRALPRDRGAIVPAAALKGHLIVDYVL